MDNQPTRRIPIVPFGLALSAFFAVTFTICILGYLFVPIGEVQHESLSIFLPGFKLLTWGSFFLGLIESIIWGWYIALVFGPIYNVCVARAG
jgi:hypothetical protein